VNGPLALVDPASPEVGARFTPAATGAWLDGVGSADGPLTVVGRVVGLMPVAVARGVGMARLSGVVAHTVSVVAGVGVR
jgi:hypothetical protein